jgi:cardiolipin synthase
MRIVIGLVLGATVLFATMSALTFVSSGAPGDGVFINEVMYDPYSPEIDNEWVELWNSGTQAVNIGNWSLLDQDGDDLLLGDVDFVFPNIDFPVDAYITVHTGQGQNSTTFVDGKAEFYMWKGTAIWSPTGDDVLLANSTCATVDFMSYEQWDGTSTDGPPADFPYTHSNATADEGFSIALVDGQFRQSIPTPLEHNGEDEYVPLLITEVYYAPWGENEYVSVHNPTGSDIDVSFWYLTDGNGIVAFPADTHLASGQSMTVCQNSTNYYEEKLTYPDYEYADESSVSADMITIGTAPQYSNGGGEVFLMNNFGTQMDAFVYGDSAYTGTGWSSRPAEALSQGKVAKRNYYGIYEDTNTSADWTNLRKFTIAQSDFPVQTFTVSDGLGLFTSPDSSFGEIVKAVNLAQSTIDINLYEFTNTALAAHLIEALGRGVKVNLFLEGAPVGGVNATEYFIARQIVENGGSIRMMTNDEANDIHQRYSYDHAKYAVFDNYSVIVMSENWVWTGVPPTGEKGNRGWGVCIDDAMLAQCLSDLFFTDWNPLMKDSVVFDPTHPKWNDGVNCSHYSSAFEPNFQAERITTAASVTPVIVPEHGLSQETVLGMLANADSRVWVEQFYIYKHWGDQATGSPAETPNVYLEAVIDAARRGCEVRVLLDASYYNTDSENPIDNDDTVEYLNSIADTEGLDMEAKLVNLPEHGFGKIHNKGMIADDSVLISSINWNLNSVTKNRELGLITENTEVADYFSEVFDHDWTDDLTPPEASFNLNDTYEVNEIVKFNASASTDNVGIVNHTWVLDGAIASYDPVWERVFLTEDNHTMVLLVGDDWANVGSASRDFSVVPIYVSNGTNGDDGNGTTDGPNGNDTDAGGDSTALIIGLVLLAPLAVFIGILYVVRVKNK